LSQELGLIAGSDAERIEAHFAGVGLPIRIADIPGGKPTVAELIRIVGQDKKVRDGSPTLILVRGIGKAFITREVAMAAIEDFLSRQIQRDA
jgi:3-dehydroquinate synthetase